jgi:hypothetical protein
MRATPPDSGLTDFLPIPAREHILITTVSSPVLAARKNGKGILEAVMASISDCQCE